MQERDFPALYQSADALSMHAQRRYFQMLGANLALLVSAAVLSLAPPDSWTVSCVQALVLLAVLGSSVYLSTRRPDRDWYAGRAVAESVKTTAWRYMMRAEPFDGDDDQARDGFRARLRAIVHHNRQIASALTEGLNRAQISDTMTHIRSASLSERQSRYASERVRDQLDWYAGKSAHSARCASRFFVAVITVNSAAVVFAILRIPVLSVPYWPTDVLIVIAAGLMGWMQARRYTELSASYSLAAQEISLILEDPDRPMTESEFSAYVIDAENAFSREHTQWIARSDHRTLAGNNPAG